MMPSFPGKLINSCFDEDDYNVDGDNDLIRYYSRTPIRSLPGAREGSPSTPPTPRTPSGERRFRETLRTYISPQPARQQAQGAAPQAIPPTPRDIPPAPTDIPPEGMVLRPRVAEINYNLANPDAEPDIGSTDDSDDEYLPVSDEEKLDLLQGETAGVARPNDNVPESDDDPDDEEDVRDMRRRNKAQFWPELEEKIRMYNDAICQPEHWNCQCDRCLDMIAKFIVKPTIMNSTKWNRFRHEAPQEVWDMVMRGELPKGKTKSAWRNIAATPAMYLDGIKKMMGQLQKKLQQSEEMMARLDGGKLHMWQLLEFHKEKHIEFPENVDELLDGIVSHNMQKFAFSGYKQLLESTIQWLGKPDGGVPFFTIKNKREEGETDEEYQRKVKENSKKSRNDRMEESVFLSQILERMRTNKPWARFDGDIEFWKEQKSNYLSNYGGQTEVDSSCVTR